MCDSDWSAADCPREQICRESQVYPKRDLRRGPWSQIARVRVRGGLNMIFGEMKTAVLV